MRQKIVKVKGIAAGDSECWCFLVTRRTYFKVTGRNPSKYDLGRSAGKGHPYRYRLYPGHLVGFGIGDRVVSLEVSITDLGKVPPDARRQIPLRKPRGSAL